MANRSFDILEAEATVRLSPFAVIRNSGEICDGSPAAVRALQIIELISNHKSPLRAVDITRSLSISPSTLSQILKSMVDAAYLVFDSERKTYFPSIRVASSSESLSTEYFGQGFMVRLIRSLEGLTNTVQISTCQGHFMQVIDTSATDAYSRSSLDPTHSRGSLVGIRVPLFGSCIGAAWLSVQSEKSVLNSVRLCRRELGARANNVDAITRRLEAIRKQGYAFGGISDSEETENRTIAMPLPQTPNGIVMVIAIAGQSEYVEQNREELAACMKQRIAAAFHTEAAAIESGSALD